jgi:lipopolysaccharide/colanic/teichoic acid biosynthesis glycosyltransferase
MSQDAHHKPRSLAEPLMEDVIELMTVAPRRATKQPSPQVNPAAYCSTVIRLLFSDFLLWGLLIGITHAIISHWTGNLLLLTVSNEKFLGLNVLGIIGLMLGLDYFNLSDSRYALGKGITAGFGLSLINLAICNITWNPFGITSVGAVLAMHLGFGLISAYIHYEQGQPYLQKKLSSPYYCLEQALKRAFDIGACSLGLLAISPLLLVVLVLILLEGKGSPIFCQTRIGQHEHHFRMFKFRSMIKAASSNQQEPKQVLYKKQDDPRITKLGRWMRKLSIDELPQLWNVIKGDMSMVGPRPPIESEYQLMNWYHKRKFEVTPGMTGLWQIIGRVKNQRDFNAVAAYDVYYVENWCLFEDVKILLKTVPVVLFQRGAC